MKTKIFLAFCFSLATFLQVFALDLNDAAYFKPIQGNPEIQGQVLVNLDEEVWQNSNYADLNLIDQNNQTIPFSLIYQDYQPISATSKVLNLEGGEKMLDGNLETTFLFDATTGSASLILDLQKEVLVSVVDFVLSENGKYWETINLEGSSDNQTYFLIKAPTDQIFTQEKFLHFETQTLRYLKFNFGLKKDFEISEILIYSPQKSQIIFDYKPENQYRLFYGNLKAKNKVVSQINSTKDLPSLLLGSAEQNLEYNSDFDQDGISNFKDNCPFKQNSDQADNDRDGLGDVCDFTPFMLNHLNLDTDYDQIDDFSDNCPYIKNTDQSDQNDDGKGDVCEDRDQDAIIDILDNCLTVSNFSQTDLNKDGIGDACEGDYDQDGIKQAVDNCPQIANPDQKDSDQDGIGDACDNCAQIANSDQKDLNQNGIGDACEDADQDGVIDLEDNCPQIANPDQKDSDQDNKGDLCDNCLNIKNASQWDDDNDGVGNECDDDDNDGILNALDNCPKVSNVDQLDSDGDGRGDLCKDYDNDGIADLTDNCLEIPNMSQRDEDRDGIGDACDDSIEIVQNKNSQPLFLGVVGVIGIIFLYYTVQLIRQLGKTKDEE